MRVLSITILLLGAAVTAPVQATLTLDDAVRQALTTDNWALSNQLSEQALRAQALAAGQLPDPKVRLALANLPTDTFDFNQENMTQLQLGLSQQFPRGDSLQIQQQRLHQMADRNPMQRLLRRAELKQKVTELWLSQHQAQQQRALLQQKRFVFKELVSISQANFRSGSARRFEVLDAELKLTGLQDRLAQLQRQQQMLAGQLSRWLPADVNPAELAEALPELPLLPAATASIDEVQRALIGHPQLQLSEQEIVIGERGVELAEQAYKPGYKVDLGYGYRDDMDNGRDRADFFSVALTFDLPLFPEKRQDAQRNAAIHQREALKEQRLLLARELKSRLEAEQANLQGLEQRLSIYNNSYLQQLAEKRRSALQAYAASDARFNEVAAAAISELESQLQHIALQHERLKIISRINYLLAAQDRSLLASDAISTQESES